MYSHQGITDTTKAEAKQAGIKTFERIGNDYTALGYKRDRVRALKCRGSLASTVLSEITTIVEGEALSGM